MKILLIGDVHGHTRRYKHLLKKLNPERSIQLGDFGFREEHEWFKRHIDIERHKILFGNHDYIPDRYGPHSLGDYASLYGGQLFAVRGADSIDRPYRTPGVSWWEEEEVAEDLWGEIIGAMDATQPMVVISHDCPQMIREEFYNIKGVSRTSQGLQDCFDAWQPLLWVFGHHHRHIDEWVDGTRFRCLPELGYTSITLGDEVESE